MAFTGLYNEVTHVCTEPITVPAAVVLTHVLRLLMYLLLYVRSYCTYSVPAVRARTAPAVQYVLRTAIRTNCTADVRTYVF